MISESTIVNIIDNSGAIQGRCIKILLPKSHQGRRIAGVGDVLILSVTKIIPGSKIKKGDIMKALIVRTKKGSKSIKPMRIRPNSDYNNIVQGKRTNYMGYSLSYSDNSVVLVKTGAKNKNVWDLTPIGSRIRGPVCDTLKINRSCSKIISIVS